MGVFLLAHGFGDREWGIETVGESGGLRPVGFNGLMLICLVCEVPVSDFRVIKLGATGVH
jgi:hypothetical protein